MKYATLFLLLLAGCSPLQIAVTPVYQTNYITEYKVVWQTNVVQSIVANPPTFYPSGETIWITNTWGSNRWTVINTNSLRLNERDALN